MPVTTMAGTGPDARARRLVRRSLGLVAAASTALSLLAVAPTAHAETQSHDDPKRDVSTFVSGRTAPGAPQHRRVIDIINVTNAYGDGYLRLTTSFTHLAPANYTLEWEVEDAATGVSQRLSYRDIGGTIFLDGLEACEGATYRVSREKARLILRAPAECIGSPETIRVATRALRFVGPNTLRADDGFSARFDYFSPVYGPELDYN